MILIADKISLEHQKKMKELGYSVSFYPKLNNDEFISKLKELNPTIVIVRSKKVRAQHLQQASNLKCVIRAGAGYDNIDTKTASKLGIKVCNVPGRNAVAVAELVLGHIIALDRRIVENKNSLTNGLWNKAELGNGMGLKGKTIGIVGFGNIGRELAQRAIGFGMNVLFVDPLFKLGDIHTIFGKNCLCVRLNEIQKQADIISLHLPKTKSTIKMINREFLERLKSNCILINTSRAEVIDEADLLNHLNCNKSFKFGSDVFNNEPSKKKTEFKNKLSSHPRVSATCHIGASTKQAELSVGDGLVENLSHYKQKGRFLNVVNDIKPKL